MPGEDNGNEDNKDKPGESSYSDEVAAELERLKAYKLALEQEFKDADPEDPETVAKARKRLFELIPDAGDTLRSLMKFSESDAVRAGIAKFVYGEALKAAKAGSDGDELSKLIKDLTKTNKE